MTPRKRRSSLATDLDAMGDPAQVLVRTRFPHEKRVGLRFEKVGFGWRSGRIATDVVFAILDTGEHLRYDPKAKKVLCHQDIAECKILPWDLENAGTSGVEFSELLVGQQLRHPRNGSSRSILAVVAVVGKGVKLPPVDGSLACFSEDQFFDGGIPVWVTINAGNARATVARELSWFGNLGTLEASTVSPKSRAPEFVIAKTYRGTYVKYDLGARELTVAGSAKRYVVGKWHYPLVIGRGMRFWGTSIGSGRPDDARYFESLPIEKGLECYRPDDENMSEAMAHRTHSMLDDFRTAEKTVRAENSFILMTSSSLYGERMRFDI